MAGNDDVKSHIPDTGGVPSHTPLPLPGTGLRLTSPVRLHAMRQHIADSFAERPDLARMLFVNPALAIEGLGYEVPTEMKVHILQRLSAKAEVRDEMERLRALIAEALPEGEDAATTNVLHPSVLARILFQHIGLCPRRTDGHSAPKIALQSDRLDRILKADPGLARALSPDRQTTRLPGAARGSRFSVVVPVPRTRLTDPKATVPDLPPTTEIPAELEPEQLFFYRKDHPVAEALFQYYQLSLRRIVFASPASFREQLAKGGPTGWQTWIQSVRFKPKPDLEK